jgi:hypothetical protein
MFYGDEAQSRAEKLAVKLLNPIKIEIKDKT